MPLRILPSIQHRTLLLLCTMTAILLNMAGCQSFRSNSWTEPESKYSLKKRKSYISCIAAGSSALVTRPLPLKVPEQSFESFLSSIENSLGTLYRPGGANPDGFDCSGFVGYLYKKHFRMLLPRSSAELASLGTLVEPEKLQPGDLVFFSISGAGIDHVGIFIGHNHFAHAARQGVLISALPERYYQTHFACAARLITKK